MMLKVVLTLSMLLPFINCINNIPERLREMTDSIHKQCIEETGASEDIIEDARNGKFADDEKFKCFLKCTMVVTEVLNDDYTVNIDALIAVLPSELPMLVPVVRNCGVIKGSSSCDTAFLSYKCWYEGDPAHFFIL